MTAAAFAVGSSCAEEKEEPFVPDTSCAPGGGCIAACAPGNSLGIGKACTKGGGQCTPYTPPAGGPSQFRICTADINPNPADPAFCTTFCGNDTDCGEGAKCVGDARGQGCVPDQCLPEGWDGGLPLDGGPGAGDGGPSDAGTA